MGHIVSIHSYRGGTGKSNVLANLAYLTAQRGRRVALVDTDLQSPGLHLIFGFQPGRVIHTLSDFVFGKCELEEASFDLTKSLQLRNSRGALFLLPSSLTVEAISRILSGEYDVARLNDRLEQLIRNLELDVVFLDTHPGLNRETLLTSAISDALIVLLRPDCQDFHGTSVLIEVAQRLNGSRIYLVPNMVTRGEDPAEVRREIRETFGHEVVGVFPFTEEMAELGSRELFSVRYSSHPLTAGMNGVLDHILKDFDDPRDD